jgi:hypothetical protein
MASSSSVSSDFRACIAKGPEIFRFAQARKLQSVQRVNILNVQTIP